MDKSRQTCQKSRFVLSTKTGAASSEGNKQAPFAGQPPLPADGEMALSERDQGRGRAGQGDGARNSDGQTDTEGNTDRRTIVDSAEVDGTKEGRGTDRQTDRVERFRSGQIRVWRWRVQSCGPRSEGKIFWCLPLQNGTPSSCPGQARTSGPDIRD